MLMAFTANMRLLGARRPTRWHETPAAAALVQRMFARETADRLLVTGPSPWHATPGAIRVDIAKHQTLRTWSAKVCAHARRFHRGHATLRAQSC